MLYQLHHQNKANRGKTEFCSQKEIQNITDFEEWLTDVQQSFPIPKGFDWLCCNEKSEYFMAVVAEEGI